MGVEVLAVASIVSAGYSIYEAEEAKKQAKKDTQKQEAIIAKKEKMIEEETKKQEKVKEERRERLAKNELLSGGATGLINSTGSNTSLLGVKNV